MVVNGFAADADVTGLTARAAALRQAARLPKADHQVILDAALAELDAAVAALDDPASGAGPSDAGRAPRSDRRLLHAVFTAAPVPLYVVAQDGTVLRANTAASELLGAAPGYVTGKPLTALVEPAARAALRSQLAAAGRGTGDRRLPCGVLANDGVVPCHLVIEPLVVRGEADRLLVSVTPVAAFPAGLLPAPAVAATVPAGPDAAPAALLADAARRLDLLADAARLLLESTSVSESVLLQRSARLVASSLATWAIVDVHRRGQLRRHFVAGPDDPQAAALSQLALAADPAPGSVPDRVAQAREPLLLTHVADDMVLGPAQDGPAHDGPAHDGLPLLAMLDAASVLSVPMTDGTTLHGVLTLVRRADDGQFTIADSALAEQLGALLGRAISARRTLRQRTEAAAALRASLLPPVLKPVPGVEIAAAHLPPTRGREVGGDFYDVYPTPGGWGVAIGDVCGKGEDGAAATAAARHAIRVLAHSDADPARVLRGANDIMLAEEFGGRFVTAIAAHLSWHEDLLHVTAASAGHPGPVLLRPDGQTQLLPGGGVPLGIFGDPEPGGSQLELREGDVLFLYTDGLADARSRQATPLAGTIADRLAHLAGRPAADIVADMRAAALDFCDGVLLDDLTMLVLQVGRPPR